MCQNSLRSQSSEEMDGSTSSTGNRTHSPPNSSVIKYAQTLRIQTTLTLSHTIYAPTLHQTYSYIEFWSFLQETLSPYTYPWRMVEDTTASAEYGHKFLHYARSLMNKTAIISIG